MTMTLGVLIGLLAQGRMARADAAVTTIVALGDSTTAGAPGFRSPLEAPPEGSGDPQSQYAYWLTLHHPEWRVLNRGVSGQRTDEILARFTTDVIAASPQIVIILAGVNDLHQGKPVGWVTKYLARMYAQAHRAHIVVVACSILPYDAATDEVRRRMKDANDWIVEYTQTHPGMLFCDTARSVEHTAYPGRLISTTDGLHPDVAAYRMLGSALAGVLEQALDPTR